jgi:SAM-dependent methyltransferase
MHAQPRRGLVRRLTDRSKWLLCAHLLAKNYRTRMHFASGAIESDIGSTHQRKDVAASVRYIREVYDDYIRYGGLSAGALNGRSVLELGPGDNFGVALLFLAAGAQRAICLDKFYSRRDEAHQREIYERVRRELAPPETERFDAALDLNNKDGIRFAPERLECLYGFGVEEAASRLDGMQFDFIVSRAVLEEVHNIDGAFASMDRLLRPGGMLIHKVDLSDYRLFSSRGFSPLEFLSIPDIIYDRMSSDSGLPNRRRRDYYASKLRALGYEATLSFTAVLNRPLSPYVESLSPDHYTPAELAATQQIRPRLCAQFRGCSDEDLLATGIFIAARKPERAA